MQRITDEISYIQAFENPLSADIGIIHGDTASWLFDVGNGLRALNELKEVDGKKNIILSHFHPDHIGNLTELEYDRLFVGANTFKYTGCGEVVSKDLILDDGVKLLISPFASSHAKGSLLLEVNEEYLFLGDAFAPTVKSGKSVYNAQLLLEQIRHLKRLKADKILFSHSMYKTRDKYETLGKLEEIYSGRDTQNPYIEVKRNDIF